MIYFGSGCVDGNHGIRARDGKYFISIRDYETHEENTEMNENSVIRTT